MKTALKVIGIVVLLLVVVIGGVLLALPYMLSTDLVKSKVAELVEQKTGRKLVIKGDTSFKLFPNIAVSLDDLSLSSPQGMKGAPLVQMASLRTNLKLMPLFKGQAEVDSVTLIKPRFNLLVDQNGRRNWDFNKGGKATGSGNSGKTDKTSGNKFSLGKVTIKEGFLHYLDSRDKIDEKVENINLALLQKPSDRSITSNGNLRWHEETLNITAMIGEPDKLMAGKQSDVLIQLKSQLTETEYVGSLLPGDQPALDGFIKTDTPSVRKLATFLGKDLPAGSGYGKLKLNTHIKADAKTIDFNSDYIQFDNMNIVATGTVKLQQPRPHIKADVEIDRLDLNPYLQAKTEGTPPPAGSSSGGNGTSTSSVDSPVDLSGLKAIDGRFSLKTKEILYQKARLGEGVFNVVMDKGRANATIEQLNLYRGSATGKLVLDGSGTSGFIGGNLSLKDVLAGAILRDLAGFDKLAGKGSVQGDFTMRGNTTNALKKSLKGTTKLSLLDGRIEGFDLAKYVSDLTGTNIPGSDQSSAEKPMTAYDELSGLLNIDKGVAHNKDFLLTGKFFRVRAAGSANIVDQTLRLRIAPKLFSGNWNFAPPLRVTGPWSAPKVKLDALAFLGGGDGVVRSLGGLLRGEKVDLGDVLKKRGLQTDDEIETYLAGKKVDASGGQPANGNQPAKKDPLGGLGGLLGGDKEKSTNKLLKDLFQ